MARFEKGRSGNPKGRPKGPSKVSRELRQFWQEFFDSEEYRAALRRRLLMGRAPHMERELHHYCFGKPQNIVELHGQVAFDPVAARESLRQKLGALAARLGVTRDERSLAERLASDEYQSEQ